MFYCSSELAVMTEKPDTDEGVWEAISEWPVTGDHAEYLDTRTEHIHNPESISSFFLRNVGRKKGVCNFLCFYCSQC